MHSSPLFLLLLFHGLSSKLLENVLTAPPTSSLPHSSTPSMRVAHLSADEVVTWPYVGHHSVSSPCTVKFPISQDNIQALEELSLLISFLFSCCSEFFDSHVLSSQDVPGK